MKNGEEAPPLELGSEYEVVRWPLNWGGASILAFALAFSYANSADYTRGWVRVWSESSILLVLGLVCGLVGRRRDKSRFPALVGNLLNGGILLSFLLVAAVFFAKYYQII